MPDPIVVLDPREQELDFLFDIRTGYQVNDPVKEVGHYDLSPYGEGNSEIFHILRAKRKDVPKQWTAFDNEGNRSRVRKLDLSHFMANAMPTNRVKSGLLPNVYSFKARFVAGSDEDFKTERSKYDDRKNTVRTVGTGYTFATIQASINAGASGDVSLVYGNAANAYPENLTTNALDAYQLVADESNGPQGIAINPAAGDGLTITDDSWYVDNFHFERQGAAAGTAVRFDAGANDAIIARCTATNWGNAFYNAAGGRNECWNCAAWDNSGRGFYGALGRQVYCYHCTATDNPTAGFAAATAGNLRVYACLGSNNLVDFINGHPTFGGWNSSSDLTAPAPGSRTGFPIANIVNNWQLAFAGENGANIDGWPVLVDEDALGNTRERDTIIFYAGAHDPYVAPTGGEVTCLGILDASPAAQGSIWVRWFEGCFTGAVIPYRYDFHVKRFDEGLLTPAEINAGTYYARSLTADELLGCGGSGLSGNGPGVLQALLAFESPGDITLSVIPNDENMHLFTNRQYWIAVRCIGIDPATNIIYEDDNVLSILSYSSGHQGELWTSIINWPCLELCAGNPTQDIHVDGSVDATITNLPDPLNMKLDADLPTIEVQPLDITVRGGDYPPTGQPGGGPAGG